MNTPLQSAAIAIDAPIDGWDAFHSFDNMPTTAAIVLDNIIPGAGSCRTREGYLEFADLQTDQQVQTVASLYNETGSILIAASAGGVWRVDDTPAGVSAQVVTQMAAPGTYINDKWQTENFRKADERGIMVMCNGIDNAQVVEDISVTPTPDWQMRDIIDTDLVGVEFIGCVQYKGRMYYWKDNDNAFYYAQAGAYEGVLKKFDLGSFAQKGGELVIIGTWTQQDSGDGKDDFIFFMFSTGEILLYQGDDPESVGYWEFIGRYHTAEPMSVRGVKGFGSDTILMTRDGYVNMATIVQQGRTSDVQQFSKLIHRAVIERTSLNYLLYGWDVELMQRFGLMLFNVPLSDSSYEQHVLNTVTMRWCRFTDININCLEVHNERLFGGGNDGKVYAIMEGVSDLGNPIYFTALPAYNTLENPGLQKHLTAAQILSTWSQPEYYQITGYADYDDPDFTLPVDVPPPRAAAAWSINPAGYTPPPVPPDPDPMYWPVPADPEGAFWDQEFWASQNNPYTTKGWQNVSAFGYAVSILIRFATIDEPIEWRSTNLRYHIAGAQ